MSAEHFSVQEGIKEISRMGARRVLRVLFSRPDRSIDPSDPRDYGGMTFDLTTEPDAEFLLAKPPEITEADTKFFENLPGYVEPQPDLWEVKPAPKDPDWS